MTFRDYIRAIVNTKIFIGGQEQFLIDLFQHAGALKPVERDTAKSWIAPENSSRYRNCKIRSYFQNDTLNETGFIHFIRRRANTSWPELQNAFRSINNDGIVNLATDDPEIFYWSLLNQFQKIHRLPLSEMPAKKMLKFFKNALEYSGFFIFFEDYDHISADIDLSGRLEHFLNRLNADIIEPFALCYREYSMYQKIRELHDQLREFVLLHSSSMYSLLSYYRSYYDDINYCRQRIETLYREILDIHPEYKYVAMDSPLFDGIDQQTDPGHGIRTNPRRIS